VLRQDVPVPDLEVREQRILLSYGIAATAYATGFTLLIASRLVAYTHRTLGVLVAGLLVFAVLFMFRAGLTTLLRAVRNVVWETVASGWRAVRTGGARGNRWRAGLAFGVLLLVVSAFVPVWLTAHGTFVLAPVTNLSVTAPASGVISDVFVREGDAVVVGSPVVRLADFELSRVELQRLREADSLFSGAQSARALSRTGESDVLVRQSEGASARSGEVRARLDALRIRARVGGLVVSPHPERLIGRHVQFGDTLLQLADLARIEAIVRLDGAGAVGVHVGDRVRLLSFRNTSRALDGVVATVSPVANATARAAGAVEARVRVSADAGALAGATGEARVTWRQTTLLGAMVWSIRSRLRSDLLL